MKTFLLRCCGWLGFFLLAASSLQAQRNPSWSEQVREIRAFPEPLVWVGDVAPSQDESQELFGVVNRLFDQIRNPEIIRTAITNGASVAVSVRNAPADYHRLEEFLRLHPDSPWAPSLRANLGLHYRETGRYTLALEHWERAWAATKSLQDSGKHVADFTLAHWSSLLASLGRVETLRQLFAETQGRVLDGGYLQHLFDSTREGYRNMLVSPGASFQCGTYALKHVAAALDQTSPHPGPLPSDGRGGIVVRAGASRAATSVENVLAVPSPTNGFTLRQLWDLAGDYGLDLTPLKRKSGERILVPSVVHWKQNHYAAIVAEQAGLYRVADPTFGEAKWLDGETINAEASGYFMAAKSSAPADWEQPSAAELARVHGQGAPNHIKDENDQHACGLAGANGTECSTNCTGMVRWWVSEPYISLWLEDEPLGYQPSRGPRVAFHLSFTQRDTSPANQSQFGFGESWECSWSSSAVFSRVMATATNSQTNVTYDAAIYLPGGGVQRYSATNQLIGTQAPNYYSQSWLKPIVNSSLALVGVERNFPDGSRDIYQAIGIGTTTFLLSSRVDPLGNSTTFNYSSSYRLTNVVDVDGRAYTLSYTNASNPNLVTKVTDPFARTANLFYLHSTSSGGWYLTDITDPASLNSHMQMDTNYGTVSWLATPYGYTFFTTWNGSTNDYLGSATVARGLAIEQPDGGFQQYIYRDDCSGVLSFYDTFVDVPSNSSPLGTLENTFLKYRNTFYWNPRQYALLSSSNPNNLTAADHNVGRLRHWLHLSNAATQSVSATLSMERAPSPDGGGTPGQKVWYDYAGKSSVNYEGSSGLPAVIVRTDPGSTNIYHVWYQRNAFGNPTNVVDTWSADDNPATAALRTNGFVYAANNIDLIRRVGPSGEFLEGTAYNSLHQPTYSTNALLEVTSFSYNILNQLQEIDFPNGLKRVFTYYGSGTYVNWLQQVEDQPLSRTESFDYSNGLVAHWTDGRGLPVSLLWDNLQRPVSIGFPDSTTISNRYTFLDLSATKDRLGNWTYLTHNSMRQLVAITNALTDVTQFSWCSCGTLESITDPLNSAIHFLHDYGSRLTNFYHADTYVGYVNDSLNRRVSETVTGDNNQYRVTTFTYTLGGLPARAYTPTGLVFAVKYDNRDRPIAVTNSAGFALTNGFDNVDRILARGWPDNSLETFLYSTNGLVGYTDRLSHTTRYFRDLANRSLNVTNANTNTTFFGFNAAGDLTSLTDGNSQTTTWKRDVYGLVRTNVSATGADVLRLTYNANLQLTNRWTPAQSNTVYKLDALGNVTNISYAVGTPSVSYRLDALTRLTNMVDGIGATVFTWRPRGLPLTEDGPWTSDTVTLGYSTGLRETLNLQQPSAADWAVSYSHDASLRMQTLTSPAGDFNYQFYSPTNAAFDNRIVSLLGYPNHATNINSFDNLAQLLATELDNSSGSRLDRQIYAYSSGGLRTNAFFNAAKDYWDCLYDPTDQLLSAQVAHQGGARYDWEKFNWSYDPAQNVKTRGKGGLSYTFNPTANNSLSNVTRSGTMTVVGFATNNPSSVTVNGLAATLYGTTFAAPGVTVSNGANTFTAIAQDTYGRHATNVLTANYPATLTCSNDANGNLTFDGKRTFDFDSENRPTNIYSPSLWRTTLAYDGLSRLRIFREYTWTNSAWKLTNEVRLIYDGLLVIQERDSNNVPKITYTRGPDLSGTFQGAGGIGGLLGLTTHTNTTNFTHYFYHSDGAGNITALVDTNQVAQALYAYEPFGNLWAQSGSLTNLNRYRFSSELWLQQANLYVYPFRIYVPEFNRWLTEDPIGVVGGVNVKRFVGNDPLNKIDPHGFQAEAEPTRTGEINEEIMGGLGANYRPPGYRLTREERFYEEQGRLRMREESIRAGRDPDVTEIRAPSGNEPVKMEPLKIEPDEVITLAGTPCRPLSGGQLPKGGVYSLRNPETDEIMRTGRTKDLERREGEHRRDPILGGFEFEPLFRTDRYSEQRGLEQLVHESYQPQLNLINPISPTNPNRVNYIYSAQQFLQGGGQ